MFVPIGNTPRDYAWGSTDAIPDLLGTPRSDAPQAELWLGAHPGSPSRILAGPGSPQAATLADWIARDPAAALGEQRSQAAGAATGPDGTRRLPFLLKVLAAAAPLSLQAHPTPEQARAGFERENRLGVPLDDPARNYKDPFHKPEMIYAVSEHFDALCGFRAPVVSADLLARLAADADDGAAEVIHRFAARLAGGVDRGPGGALPRAVAWLLGGGDGVAALVDAVVAAAQADGADGLERETVRTLAATHPGDPGIVLSLLLNRVRLTRGEALYLPAGNIHAYLSGLGVELMAASDNVLRGGLTGKHIDVPELLAVLDFSPSPVPYLRPAATGPGVEVFRPDVPDFVMTHLRLPEADGAMLPSGPSIALCVAGEAELAGAHGSARLARGEAVFVTPAEGAPEARGSGELFVASVGA